MLHKCGMPVLNIIDKMLLIVVGTHRLLNKDVECYNSLR